MISNMGQSHFGQNLKYLRKQAGLTQKKLGELIGVGQVAIANYEKGQRFPGEQVLLDLVSTLNTTLDSLMGIDRTSYNLWKRNFSYALEDFLQILEKDDIQVAADYLLSWKAEKKMNLIDLFESIISPALFQIGLSWQNGDYTVSTEHLMSGKIRDLITILDHFDFRDGKNAEPGKRWMGLCPPGEEHDLGLKMLASAMRHHGWVVKNLGCHVPFPDLLGMLEDFQPVVLAFSCVNPGCVNAMESYAERVAEKYDYPLHIQAGGAGLAHWNGGTGTIIHTPALGKSLELADKFFTGLFL